MRSIVFLSLCWASGSYGRRVQATPSTSYGEGRYVRKIFRDALDALQEVGGQTNSKIRPWEAREDHRSSKSVAMNLFALNPTLGLRAGIGDHRATLNGRPRKYQARSYAPAAVDRREARRDEMSGNSIFLLPRVKYTVPSQNVGWKGRPEFDEDPSMWYDAKGVRNGPPPNYWRQAADERSYKSQVEAAASTLVGDTLDESKLIELEKRMSIKNNPHLNRKLLGEWLPLVMQGKRVAQAVGGGLAVPAAIAISRSNGRKTKEHSYGTIDLHLEEGESLSIKVINLATPDAPPFEGILAARGTSERRDIVLDQGGAEKDTSLDWLLDPSGIMHFGGISFLDDYVMVQRAESGELSDVYIRRDMLGSQVDTPADRLPGDQTLDVEDALQRSRQDRVSFRKQMFDAIAHLKADIPNILSHEPHWEDFAEDFELLDGTSGSTLKGLGATKVLLELLKEFHRSLDNASLFEDKFTLLDMEVRRPPHTAEWTLEIRLPDAVDISFDTLCAMWESYLGFLPRPVEADKTYSLPLVIAGESTFMFNSEGKVSGTKINSLSINGKALKFPQHNFPDYSNMSLGDAEETALKNWAKDIFRPARVRDKDDIMEPVPA